MSSPLLAAVFEFGSAWVRGMVSVAIAATLLVSAWILGRGARRAFEDPQQSYNARPVIRGAAWITLLVSLVVIWRPLGGNLAPAT